MLNFPLKASCLSSKSISGCRVYTEGFRSGKLSLAEWERESRNLGTRKIFSLTQVFWTGASVRIECERRPEADEELRSQGREEQCLSWDHPRLWGASSRVTTPGLLGEAGGRQVPEDCCPSGMLVLLWWLLGSSVLVVMWSDHGGDLVKCC